MQYLYPKNTIHCWSFGNKVHSCSLLWLKKCKTGSEEGLCQVDKNCIRRAWQFRGFMLLSSKISVQIDDFSENPILMWITQELWPFRKLCLPLEVFEGIREKAVQWEDRAEFCDLGKHALDPALSCSRRTFPAALEQLPGTSSLPLPHWGGSQYTTSPQALTSRVLPDSRGIE